ncbi:MAG: flagellar hook capping protein [Actinomycetia bacterium]|nr:flagellar hook capping protein [Actinomycetes bacterium]
MNPTSGVSSTTGAAGLYASLPSTSGGPDASLFSQNNFMQLLVAELQNQDPLSPMSSSDFIQQMTSLSLMTAMEQLAQYMSTLGQLAEAQAAVSLLGHTVSADPGSGTVTGQVQQVLQSGGNSPTLVVATTGGSVDVPLSSVESVS